MQDPKAQGYPPPQGQGYPPPQGQGYPPPQGQGYPPPPAYTAAGGQPQYPPPAGQPQYAQPQTVQQTVVVTGCTHPGFTTEFTACGIILCILFFPLGIICLFALTEKRCVSCGAIA